MSWVELLRWYVAVQALVVASAALVTLLSMYAPQLRRDASLVLVTEHVRPPLAAFLQNLRHGGFVVRVLCVSEPISYRSSFAALAAVGIDCQLIRDEEDMNEIAIRGI